jgi:glutaredoxin
MLNLVEITEIIKTENVIFSKSGCPFCKASKTLMNSLQEKNIIKFYKTLTLDQDFNNDLLKIIVSNFGWKPASYQQYPTKPQIFINIEKTEYIGGNKEFYNSFWNLGINNKIKLKDKIYEAPNLKNPMF